MFVYREKLDKYFMFSVISLRKVWDAVNFMPMRNEE